MHSDSSAPLTDAQRIAAARGDFVAAFAWIIFGVAVTIGAWNMDRLEKQDINPYTIPGLVPGLLGLAVIFFGLLMALRAWQRGALGPRVAQPVDPARSAARKRFAMVLTPCLVFGVVLLGHGLPFWLAAALFVAATISLLQYPERKANGQVLRGIAVATMIGLCAGGLITLIFQEFFLVRLP